MFCTTTHSLDELPEVIADLSLGRRLNPSREALRGEALQQTPRGSSQVTRQFLRDRLALADHLGSNGAIGRGDRHFDHAGKLPSARGFELPHEQGDRHRGGTRRVHQPNVRARGEREPKGRVEIAVWRRRPAPGGILGQLAAGPLVEQPETDVPASLCVEEPDESA